MNNLGNNGLGGLGNPEQLQELMKLFGNVGAGAPKKTESTQKGQSEEETSSTSEGKDNYSSIDPDGLLPCLFPPLNGLQSKFTGNFSNSNGTNGEVEFGAAATRTTGIEEMSEEEEAQGLLNSYAEVHKGIAVLRSYQVDDVKILQMINDALEEQGIITPVTVRHPKLEGAVEKAMLQYFTEFGYLDAAAKAAFASQASSFQNNLIEYSDHLETIQPTGNTFFDDPKLSQLNVRITSNMLDQVDMIMDVLESTPSMAEYRGSTLNYLKIIADLCAELKVMFMEMQMADLSTAGKTARAKEKMTGDLLEGVAKRISTMMAQAKFQTDIKMATKFFKVFSPVLSGGCVALSIICCIFMFPMGLLIAAIAIVMFVLITTLSTIETEDKDGKEISYLQYIFDGITNGIGNHLATCGVNMGISQDKDLLFRVAKIVFWVGVILVMLVAMAVAVLVPTLGPVVIAVLMPMLSAVLQNSGLMKEVMGWILESEGYKKDDKLRIVLEGVATAVFSTAITMAIQLVMKIVETAIELIKQIIEMVFKIYVYVCIIIVVIILVIIFLICGVAPGVILAVVAIVAAVVAFVAELLQILMKILISLIQSDLSGMIKQILALVMAVVQFIVSLLMMIISLVQAVGQAGVELAKTFIDTMPKLIKQLIEVIKNVLKALIAILKSLFDNVKKLLMEIINAILDLFVMLTQAFKQFVQGIVSLGMGAVNLRMAEFVRESGKIEAFIETMKEILKIMNEVLEKILGRANDGLNTFNEQIEDLSQLFKKLVEDLRGVGDELYSSAIA